jgi:dTDP-4-dehydrorhamnose reductase
MKTLTVGAAGYVGGVLYREAARRGVARGTSSTGRDGLLLLKLDDVGGFDFHQISPGEVVLFTAAVSAPDACERDRIRATAINVTGTAEFIERAMDRGARVIFLSSDAVYGERETGVDESTVCKPTGGYARMKFEIEQRFAGAQAFKAIRLSYVFSKEDKFTRYLIECWRNGIEADLFHPFLRAVIYRDDVVQGALELARRWQDFPMPALNFGGPAVLSRVDIAETLRCACLPGLRLKVTEPAAEFFVNRPRVIAMKSPLLEELLGRPPLALREAARNEFLL